MLQRFRRIAGVLTVAILAQALLACTLGVEKAAEEPEAVPPPPTTEPVPKTAPAPSDGPPPLRPEYEIVPATSSVRILVFRTGRLARQGHNHVISSPDIEGSLSVKKGMLGSKVDIRIPVSTLVVDDPEQRKEAGREFDAELSDQQIESTRRTMLGSRVLDAGPYPSIRVMATITGGSIPDLLADVQMTLRGQTQRFQVPVKFEQQGTLVTASGNFAILQTDFGIEPVSLLGGALSVKDEVKIQFRIVGRPKE